MPILILKRAKNAKEKRKGLNQTCGNSTLMGEYPRLGNLDLLGTSNSSIDKTTHEVKGERGLKPLGLLAVIWRKMGSKIKCTMAMWCVK